MADCWSRRASPALCSSPPALLNSAQLDRRGPANSSFTGGHGQWKLGHEPREGSDEYGKLGFTADTTPLRLLAKVHPKAGSKSLLIGRHAHNIPGISGEEAEALLQEHVGFACQPPHIYHQDWRAADVFWDNRCLPHRATPWNMKEARVMWHTRIAGNPVSEAALA